MSSLSVPHYEQELPSSCFAACARMVLAFFGYHHDEAELRAAMHTGSGGTRARDFLELRKLGYEVQFVTTDLAGIVAYLSAGQPPIALLDTTALPYWQDVWNHVAVDDSWVYLNDPYFGDAPKQVAHADFLRAWSASANTLAILRPGP